MHTARLTHSLDLCNRNTVSKIILFQRSSFLSRKSKIIPDYNKRRHSLLYFEFTPIKIEFEATECETAVLLLNVRRYKQSETFSTSLAKTAECLTPSYFCRRSNEDLDILSWWWSIRSVYTTTTTTTRPTHSLALHHRYFTVMASTSMQTVIPVSSSGHLQSLQAIGYDPWHVPERSPRGWRDKLWRNSKPSHSAAGHPIATQRTSHRRHFQVSPLQPQCVEKTLKFNIKFTETFFSPVQSVRLMLRLNFRGAPADAKCCDFDSHCSLKHQQQQEEHPLILQCTNMFFSCWHIPLTSVPFCLGEDWTHGTAQPLLATMWFYFLNERAQISASWNHITIYDVIGTPITRGLH